MNTVDRTHLIRRTLPHSALGGLFLLLAACSSMHGLRGHGTAPRLSREAQVFVALPADGRHDVQSYASSGAMTRDAVETAFKRHVVRVEGGTYVDTHDGALDEARRLGCSVLVVPEILHWEDQPTELTLLPDVVEVRLILVDTTNGKQLDLVTLNARSTLFAGGADHPQDMLRAPIGAYVDALF